jgi:hypothetical protein
MKMGLDFPHTDFTMVAISEKRFCTGLQQRCYERVSAQLGLAQRS